MRQLSVLSGRFSVVEQSSSPFDVPPSKQVISASAQAKGKRQLSVASVSSQREKIDLYHNIPHTPIPSTSPQRLALLVTL
jgi:hypothetical protein